MNASKGIFLRGWVDSNKDQEVEVAQRDLKQKMGVSFYWLEFTLRVRTQ
jgi:hypothetical protein